MWQFTKGRSPKAQGDEEGGSWDFDGLSPAGVSTWSHEVGGGSVSLDKRKHKLP